SSYARLNPRPTSVRPCSYLRMRRSGVPRSTVTGMTSTGVLSRSALGDIALAFGIFVAALFASGGDEAAWLYGLILVRTLPLALRRQFAVPVLIIVAAIT